MTENPIMILLYVGIAAYIGNMYWVDYKAQRGGELNEQAMPGATGTTLKAILIGVLGSLVLLGVETGGEIALGISAEQSEVVWYLVITWLCAGIVEEVIFRGYLVVDKRGRALLVGSCFGFSLIFALLHFHLFSFSYAEAASWWEIWRVEIEWTLETKGWFTTGLLLANSLWWYACRFGPWNPTQSIFPCMIAHASSNLGVFFVKLAQGFVV